MLFSSTAGVGGLQKPPGSDSVNSPSLRDLSLFLIFSLATILFSSSNGSSLDHRRLLYAIAAAALEHRRSKSEAHLSFGNASLSYRKQLQFHCENMEC
ncbi:unnamed protein product [Microthlaspi erraticum]|uniref:Uncharacterized protein n=1 Tax=Microthlaspi erraticum TaxID=1685480 RepID=A0A6D2KXC4_9BRAS|nr:unnamed protein product [Microthlaspi erraticum]